jgi:hypothetical protein
MPILMLFKNAATPFWQSAFYSCVSLSQKIPIYRLAAPKPRKGGFHPGLEKHDFAKRTQFTTQVAVNQKEMKKNHSIL